MFCVFQTGKFEQLATAMSPEEEDQMKNMLLRIDAIAKVQIYLLLLRCLLAIYTSLVA